MLFTLVSLRLIAITRRQIKNLLNGLDIKLRIRTQNQCKLDEALSFFADNILDFTAHLHCIIDRILDAEFEKGSEAHSEPRNIANNILRHSAHLQVYLKLAVVADASGQAIEAVLNFLAERIIFHLDILLVRNVLEVIVKLLNHVQGHLLVAQ